MAKKKELNTVKELLYWSYSNLAMAHTAVQKKQEKYQPFNYMIRAKLFKGLIDESMNVRTLFDDEKMKLSIGQRCSYCGLTKNLALDHIFPQKFGGVDSGDNLIYACRTCNSSKGKKDLMSWMNEKKKFPSILILRRYLKLVIDFSIKNEIMELKLTEVDDSKFPFVFSSIPITYPKPNELVLYVQ